MNQERLNELNKLSQQIFELKYFIEYLEMDVKKYPRSINEEDHLKITRVEYRFTNRNFILSSDYFKIIVPDLNRMKQFLFELEKEFSSL